MASQKWLTEAVAELREKVNELTKRVDKAEKRNEVGVVGDASGVALGTPVAINTVAAPKPAPRPKSKPKSKPAVKPAPAKQS